MHEAGWLREGSFILLTMEEPIKPDAEQRQESPDFNADLSHILSLLLTHDEIAPEALNLEVERFIAIYEPYRTDEAWIQQKSKVLVVSYLVSVLVDRFELLWPKNFLHLLLFCASICTCYIPVCYRFWTTRSTSLRCARFGGVEALKC